MKALHLLTLSAATSATLILATAEADAQQRPVSGARITFPSHANRFSWERGHGFKRGFVGGVWIVQQEVPVIVEREVIKQAPPPAPSPEGEGNKRKPYVIGNSYASLPGGCMKMIEGGASYYYCGGGEWYRQLGGGRGAKYRAVAKP